MIRDRGRRTSSGPAAISAAPTGRTYDRSRPTRSKRQKTACQQGPSTYDADIVSRSRAAFRPSFASSFSLLEIRGRRENRVLTAPAVTVRFALRKMHTDTGQLEIPAFPAEWLYGLFVLSPENGSFASVAVRGFLLADLTPASRRQDHTTSPYAPARTSVAALGVHRISPNVRDVRERPSIGRDGRSYAGDLRENESRIFLREGLDRFWVICPTSAEEKLQAFQLRTRTELPSHSHVTPALRIPARKCSIVSAV